MTDNTERDDTTPERWTYLGPYISGGHLWRDESGKRRVFKKLPARVFGGIYLLDVVRTPGEESVSVRGEARYAGEYAEDAAVVQAQASAAEAHIKRVRLEKNTSRTAQLDEALEPLLMVAAGMRNMTDRRALADYVLAKIYAAR